MEEYQEAIKIDGNNLLGSRHTGPGWRRGMVLSEVSRGCWRTRDSSLGLLLPRPPLLPTILKLVLISALSGILQAMGNLVLVS